jgi:PIN domain nuclease of toxin-antitoxin system
VRAYLLDASALLAWLHEEPGAGFVDAILEQSAISSVNPGEVLYKTESGDGCRRAAAGRHGRHLLVRAGCRRSVGDRLPDTTDRLRRCP